MKEIIESIIGNIPQGKIFDTHAVIEYLLQNNPDEYLSNYNGKTTELYHGYISQIISGIAEVQRIGDSWSRNIHMNFSECACWKKL